MRHLWLPLLILSGASMVQAADSKIGLSINVDGKGAFWNPVVTHIWVTAVANGSLAQTAGLREGDEIVQIDGHAVVGRRAADLKPFMVFKAGDSRVLSIRHSSGELTEVRLTKALQ